MTDNTDNTSAENDVPEEISDDTALVPVNAQVAKRQKNLRRAFRIKRTIPLDVVAGQLADDLIAAVYSAVGNKEVDNLREGDGIDDVVDQSLTSTGMYEFRNRLSSTRIEVKIGTDVSGSMFSRGVGSPIVKAMTLKRLLRNATEKVALALPPDVFKASYWLWAVGWSRGKDVLRVDSDVNVAKLDSTFWNSDFELGMKDPDKFLEGIARASRWPWQGSATYLGPMLSAWEELEKRQTDYHAHRLDIVITDGQIHDPQECAVIQSSRNWGRHRALLFNISGWLGKVPDGFTGYHLMITDLEPVIKEEMERFIQEMA